MLILLSIAALLVAWANGGNDNFKGVATLYGSATTTYRKALALATASTLAGSVASVFLAASLVERFSGTGLVPDAVSSSPEFLVAVALGAGLTVILATLTGFPISTTHGLTGALVGAGLVTAGHIRFSALGSNFLLPLIVSPLIAVLLAALFYRAARRSRLALGIEKESCACVTSTEATWFSTTAAMPIEISSPAVALSRAGCDTYTGSVLGIRAQSLLNVLHTLSAALVSFARGLNDTPKIVGLLVAAAAFRVEHAMLGIAVAMAMGGILHSRRVAETISHRITPMNHKQGFAANIVTGFLVIVASRMGLPVSTTHVSVGSIFGIGVASGTADRAVIRNIALSWVLTLPVAAAIAAVAAAILS